MKIFVAKLSFDTTDDGLREAFENFGTVDSAKVIMDNYTNRSKGFGFVEMADKASAQNAINELDNSELDGRVIVVKEAEERRPSNNRGNGGYNNRY